jgi:hypothetical protein
MCGRLPSSRGRGQCQHQDQQPTPKDLRSLAANLLAKNPPILATETLAFRSNPFTLVVLADARHSGARLNNAPACSYGQVSFVWIQGLTISAFHISDRTQEQGQEEAYRRR